VPTNPAPAAGTTQINCIIAGINNNTIANGLVANVVAQIAATAPVGSAAVTLSGFQSSNLFGRAIKSVVNPGTWTVNINPTISLACAAAQIEPGEDVACTVSLAVALTTDSAFTITTSTPGIPGIIVPTSVVVKANTTSQGFVVTGQ